MIGRAYLQKALLHLARTAPGGAFLRLWLHMAPGSIPLKPLYRSRSLLVVPHPSPAYPVHLLFLPLPPLSGVSALEAQHDRLLAEVVNTAHQLVIELGLPPACQLVVNAGAYQEVAVLHFHLVSHPPGTAESIGRLGSG